MSVTNQDAPVATEEAPSPLKAALSAVNQLAIELAALAPGESVQSCLSERLRDLTGAVLVAFSDFDPRTSTLMTSYIAAPSGILDGVNGALGRRMVGQVYHVGDAERREMTEKLVSFPGTLSDITFGRIPSPVAAAAQRLFGVDRFLSLNYSVRGELYGTSMLALRVHTADPAPEMLEAIASVGAVSLCRRRAEAALYALNSKLEKRIAERTKAIERANEDLSDANRLLAALNADLEQTVHLLDEATQAKSEFLARVSHELRTPLNSIIGFSGTMLGGLAGEVNPEQERQLRMISTSGKHLLGLINEILDLTRIEARASDVAAVDVDPAGVAEKVLRTVAPLADEKGLDLRRVSSGSVPHLITDPRRVEQVLLNLLGNAVKFTDRGEVVLRVAGDRDGVVFDVSDTGGGIAQEHQARIFEEFYRAPQADGSVREGSGLGLSVTRSLVESLGGEIAFTSQPGAGSTFSVWFPLQSG
jgi:signal transduction histidine kinase